MVSLSAQPLNNNPPLSQDAVAVTQRLAVLEVVLDESTDPIFSILQDGTYRFVNKAFSRPLGREPGEVIGQRIWDLFSPDEAEKRMAVVRRAFATGQTIDFDVRVPTAAGDRFYITSVKPLLEDGGGVAVVVCISKDITQRKQFEQEREDLICNLQAALDEVRSLSGLLPICSHCKKIRDDDQSWIHVEQYIRDHSEASFTHGICPDCHRTHFPEVP